MSFEVTCGQCSGRLRVDQGGMVVACPHCGAHLDIADPNAAAAPPATEAPASQPAAEPASVPEPAGTPDFSAPQTDTTAQPSAPADIPFPSFDSAPAEAGGIPGFDPTAPMPEVAAPASIDAVPTEVAVPETAAAAGIGSTSFQGEAPTAIEAAPLEMAPAPASAPADVSPAPVEATAFAATDTVPTFTATKKSATGTVPRKTFMIVASYASAMTIASVWLLMKVLNPTANNLESLPDLEPAKRSNGEIGYDMIPEDAPMPIGHSLNLGDEQRYGNLIVTPLRVSRGPLEFEHYDPTSTATREPIAGVLKLWLKFQNVSEDQSIAPLRSILFKRNSSDIDNERSNTFVCRGSEKKEDGSRLLIYDHNLSGDWNIVGLDIDEEIPPGKSVELLVPTTGNGVDGLFGGGEPLVWRVHFRKGYSPKRFGVTTVVEVNFKEDDIAFDAKPGNENPPEGEPEKA